jgi:predicted ester cyclase
MRATSEDMVAEGDKLAVRWTVQGSHLGELLGIPPTGKPVRFSGISIYRLAAGKIAEQWEQWDRLPLLQQLGVLPTPAATG